MRMFVAIDLADGVKAALASDQRAIAAGLRSPSAVRMVNPDQAHLTLAFLGDVAPPLGGRLIEAMQPPFDIPRFQLAFGGFGVFPPRGAPRVLWIGVTTGEHEVIRLQKLVVERLASEDVSLEDRTFRPHLTLGRWRRSRPSDRPPLERVNTRHTETMTVDRVTLYESRLSSEGPTHIALTHALLR